MEEKEVVVSGFREEKEFGKSYGSKWADRKESKVVYPPEGASSGKKGMDSSSAKLSTKTEGMINRLISQPLE